MFQPLRAVGYPGLVVPRTLLARDVAPGPALSQEWMSWEEMLLTASLQDQAVATAAVAEAKPVFTSGMSVGLVYFVGLLFFAVREVMSLRAMGRLIRGGRQCEKLSIVINRKSCWHKALLYGQQLESKFSKKKIHYDVKKEVSKSTTFRQLSKKKSWKLQSLR